MSSFEIDINVLSVSNATQRIKNTISNINVKIVIIEIFNFDQFIIKIQKI